MKSGLVLIAMLVATTACAKKAVDENAGDAAVAATAASVPSEPKLSPRLERIVTQLRHEDERVRDGAANELSDSSQSDLEPGDGQLLVYAAAKKYPPRKAGRSTKADLLRVAALWNDRIDRASVAEVFGELDDPAKTEALFLLSTMRSVESAELVVKLVRQEVEKNGAPPAIRFQWIATNTKEPFWNSVPHLDVLVQGLMPYAKGRAVEGIFAAANQALETNQIRPWVVAPHAERITRAWVDARDRGARPEGVQALALMRWLDAENVVSHLREAVRSESPYFALEGIISLAVLRQSIAPAEIESVAARAEVRRELMVRLRSIERAPLVPSRYRTTRSMAEGDLAAWVAKTTGRAPAAIELVRALTEVGRYEQHATRATQYEAFLFRYRTDGEWMTTLVGPYGHGMYSNDSGDVRPSSEADAKRTFHERLRQSYLTFEPEGEE